MKPLRLWLAGLIAAFPQDLAANRWRLLGGLAVASSRGKNGVASAQFVLITV